MIIPQIKFVKHDGDNDDDSSDSSGGESDDEGAGTKPKIVTKVSAAISQHPNISQSVKRETNRVLSLLRKSKRKKKRGMSA
jgi:hypothetical protein